MACNFGKEFGRKLFSCECALTVKTNINNKTNNKKALSEVKFCCGFLFLVIFHVTCVHLILSLVWVAE